MYNVVYNVVHSLSCFFDRVNTEGGMHCTKKWRRDSADRSCLRPLGVEKAFTV
jgi:hypothetical protein